MSADMEQWIAQAKGRDILDAARSLNLALKRQGSEHVGPCPLGCSKRDGFAVNPRKQKFLCRGAAAGTVIDMVMHVLGLEFMAACEWLNGEAPPGRKASEAALNAAPPAPYDGKADKEAEDAYRATEINKARAIFYGGADPAGTLVEEYLAARGIGFSPAFPLRYSAEQPYWHNGDVVLRGPAMLAAVTNDRGELTACHITWLDPERIGKKAAVPDPERQGQLLPAKKLRGSKRKGAIRLVTPKDATRLIMGEGIETTLSVFEATPSRSPSAPQAAYWAGIDLGHIGGKPARTIQHPELKTEKGNPRRVGGPWPEAQAERDLDIPDTITELVLLGDGDSDRFTTEMTLRRAAARFDRPGRTIRPAWAPAGLDFNDVLLGRAA